jgi:Chaperone of endosialidase
MSCTINASTTAGLISTADLSGSLQLQTNSGTTAVTIDTSQVVTLSSASNPSLIVNRTASTGDAGMSFQSTGTGVASLTGLYGGGLRFGTGSGDTERMRIDSSGNLLVGTTSPYNGTRFSVNQPTGGSVAAFLYNTGSSVGTSVLQVGKADNNSTTSQAFVQFLMNNAATGSGQINANGASQAAFGSYSDRRLKENITDLPSQLANIMALRPVEFDYIESEGGGHQIGFIAQEVKEIYPDLIGERQDGMFTLSDLNKNDARLIKAIQELKAINDQQAETINALTARVAALEAK